MLNAGAPHPLLVIFTALPPARNGIADYAAQLLAGLAKHYECVCVLADDAPPPPPILRQYARMMFISEYRAAAAGLAAERHLFQVGNNSGNAYMLPWLERASGVVTLHDPSLAHLMSWMAPDGLDGAAFRALTRASYGEWGVEYLNAILEARCAIGQELQYLRPVIAACRAVIVHSRIARLRARSEGRAPVHVIPHFAIPPAGRPGTSGASQNDTVQLLCLGFVARTKRIDLVLAAMTLLLREGLKVRLTIAGEPRAEEYDVESQIQALELASYVTLAGYVEEKRIEDLLAETDIVVNLRDPTSGETSGTLMRALAAGRCCVVSDVGAYSEFPTACVVKVAGDDMTPEGLALRLSGLIIDARRRERIAANAAVFAAKTASLQAVSERYVDAIESAYRSPAVALPHGPFQPRFRTRADADVIAASARRVSLRDGRRNLWWRERLLPVAAGEGRLLMFGATSEDAQLARDAFGWPFVAVRKAWSGAMEQAAADTPASFDAVLILLTPELADDDILRGDALMAAVRLLRPTGMMTVEIECDAATIADIRSVLHRSGYDVARDAAGITLPDPEQSEPSWTSSDAWGATFVRVCAGPLDAGPAGHPSAQ